MLKREIWFICVVCCRLTMLPLSLCQYVSVYNIVTSLFCYRLLKPHLSEHSEVYWNAEISGRVFEATAKNKMYPAGFSFEPDIENETSVAIACQGLTSNDCQRWLSCSKRARMCCKDYDARKASFLETPESHCPPFWDGMSCVNSVPNGTVLSMKCPDYYIPIKRPGMYSFLGKWLCFGEIGKF